MAMNNSGQRLFIIKLHTCTRLALRRRESYRSPAACRWTQSRFTLGAFSSSEQCCVLQLTGRGMVYLFGGPMACQAFLISYRHALNTSLAWAIPEMMSIRPNAIYLQDRQHCLKWYTLVYVCALGTRYWYLKRNSGTLQPIAYLLMVPRVLKKTAKTTKTKQNKQTISNKIQHSCSYHDSHVTNTYCSSYCLYFLYL